MSRFPFGLCLLLLCQGCASLMTQASAPSIGQPFVAPRSGADQSTEKMLPTQIRTAKPALPYRTAPEGPVIQLGLAWPLLTPPQPEQRQPVAQPPLQLPQQVVPETEPESLVNVIGVSSPIWQRELKSTTGRPVEVAQFGSGSQRVLVLGSLYGNEPESIRLLDSFVQELASLSVPPEIKLLVVRTPNPDGLAEHMRTNSHGVDLNRNFPSTSFTKNPTRLTGPRPASEIETQHVLRIIKEFQPQRVIHVRSSIGVRPLVLTNCTSAEFEKIFSEMSEIDYGRFGGEFKIGSLEEYVSLTAKAELLTIQLPTAGFPQLTADRLLTLAVTRSSENSEEIPLVPSQQSGPTVQNQKPKSARHSFEPDGEHGYVQLLPPPPQSEQINHASTGANRLEPEYFELVPPTGD